MGIPKSTSIQLTAVLFTLLAVLWTEAHAGTDLALNWKPEPEFGGFYEAQAKKYYQNQGLSLEILPGGAGQPVAQMVASKKVMFGISSAEEVVLARGIGAKIVAIFAVYQNDPQGFMVRSERNIHSLKELFQSKGTIALQKGLPFTEWLEKKYAPTQAQIVPYTGGITQFLKDQSFSQQCFVTSEPLAAKRSNVTPKTFLVSESGYNPYLTVVIVHEDTLKEHMDLVKKFIAATQQGWSSYINNPKETNTLMQKLNSSMSLADFDEAAKIQRPFIETAETKTHALGAMNADRWNVLQSQLKELKLVASLSNPNTFFFSPTK